MENRRARQILNALVLGVDPLTGEPLPGDTILEKGDVVRAMVVAVASLDAGLQRDSRRSQLPRNIGRTWSMEENSRLLDAYQRRVPLAEIAANHGRTLRAIEARLQKQGLITADQRTTADRFGPNSN